MFSYWSNTRPENVVEKFIRIFLCVFFIGMLPFVKFWSQKEESRVWLVEIGQKP